MKFVIYDCEIINAIPSSKEPRLEGITYCQGWHDHAGMGVSVIAAYVWDEGYRVFLEDNMGEFKALVEAPDTLLIGYNSWTFDDLLIDRALGIKIPRSRYWDLLRAIREARGEAPGTVGGPSLHKMLLANFLEGKSGNGAFAPLLWQKGKIGQVIDYCLGDVIRTKKLMELVMAGRLRDPDSGRILAVPLPMADQLAQSTKGLEQ